MVRMRVVNPGAKGKHVMAKRRKRHGKRRHRNPAAARVANPHRKHRKRRHGRRRRTVTVRVTNPSKRRKGRARARRYVATTGRGRRMRTFRRRNRHGKTLGHIRGYSAHRKRNPSADGILAAGVAVGIGLVTSVVVGYAVDTLLASQSGAVQTGVLVAVAAGSAFFLPTHPAIAAGIATGLLLVPLTKQVYSWFPALANPAPVTPAAANLSPTASAIASGATTAAVASTATMNALHMRSLHMNSLKHKQHKQMRSAARPWGMQALHMQKPVVSMHALHLRGMTSQRGTAPNPMLARSFGR
jgi:hypothetical protein